MRQINVFFKLSLMYILQKYNFSRNLTFNLKNSCRSYLFQNFRLNWPLNWSSHINCAQNMTTWLELLEIMHRRISFMLYYYIIPCVVYPKGILNLWIVYAGNFIVSPESC